MCCPLSFRVDVGQAQVPGLCTTKSHNSETNLSSVGREALSKWVLLPAEQEASTLSAFAITVYIVEVLIQRTKSQVAAM